MLDQSGISVTFKYYGQAYFPKTSLMYYELLSYSWTFTSGSALQTLVNLYNIFELKNSMTHGKLILKLHKVVKKSYSKHTGPFGVVDKFI